MKTFACKHCHVGVRLGMVTGKWYDDIGAEYCETDQDAYEPHVGTCGHLFSDNYNAILARLLVDEDFVDDDQTDPVTHCERYMLVERSRFGGAIWITSHATVQDAVDYHDSNEYAEDYEMESFYDLVTGEPTDVHVRSVATVAGECDAPTPHPNVRKVLDASTLHCPTPDALDGPDSGDIIVSMTGDYGWLVNVPTHDEAFAGEGFPAWIKPIFGIARENACGWILFDADAPQLAGVEVYEW